MILMFASIIDCAGGNRELAVKAGAIDAVVVAMRAHVDDAGLWMKAYEAVGKMCWSSGAFSNSVMLLLA